jgi:hypothetical protein
MVFQGDLGVGVEDPEQSGLIGGDCVVVGPRGLQDDLVPVELVPPVRGLLLEVGGLRKFERAAERK